MLCVWKRVTQPGLSLDDSSPLFDYPKELMIFWYGEEPTLTDFPGPYLQGRNMFYYFEIIKCNTVMLLLRDPF